MLSSGCHAFIVLNGVIIEAVSTEIRGHIAGTACRIGGHMALLWSAVRPPLQRALYKHNSSQPYWEFLQGRKGNFGPASKELMWNSVAFFQHLLAGSLMLVGWWGGEKRGETLLCFRLGVLTEVSGEVLDMVEMVQGKGVWATGSSEIGRGAYAAIIAHHLPGIALVFPLNIWCSCVELWQRCALALELPGAVTLLLQCYKETLEVQLNKGSPRFLLLLINMLTMILFVWARFFVVTPAMIELVTEGLKIHCRTSHALIGGAFMMTMFNIMAAIPLFVDVKRSFQLFVGRGSEARVKKVQ